MKTVRRGVRCGEKERDCAYEATLEGAVAATLIKGVAHPEAVEMRRARVFFSDERGRDDCRNLRPPGREIARILRAAAET